MGLFSSSYKTIVGTSAVRGIPDGMVPNSARDGMLRAIMQDSDIPESIMSSLSQSIGLKADQIYRYAGTSDYPMGLPTGEFLTVTRGADEVQAVLQALHGGAPIDFDYFLFGPVNFMHMAWQRLQDLRDYDEAANTVTYLAAPRTFKDMAITLRSGVAYDPASLALLGNPPNKAYQDSLPWDPEAGSGYKVPFFQPFMYANVAEEYATVEVIWQDNPPEGAMMSDTFQMPLGSYSTTDDYVMARYTVGGVNRYWAYRIGAGTYPTLDALANFVPEEHGNFFPFIHFRQNKQSLAGVEGTPGYKQSNDYKKSKKIAKKLGLNYDDILEMINENPDVADVDQSYMMFAVPANTEDPVEARYLYDFFNKYYGAMLDDAGPPPDWYTGQLSGGIFIQDTKVKMQLFAYEIDKDVSNGVIGPVGTYDVLLTEGPVNYGGYTRTEQIYYFRYQHTPTQHRFIRVVGLGMHYHIAGQYAEAVIDDFRVILVPLDRSLTETYGMKAREKLYARSLHIIFNSVQVIKVKWYQSFWFKAVMVIVQVVLAVYSLGTSEAFLAFMSTSMYAIAAMIVIEQIVIAIVINYAFQLFAKVVGAEVAMVFAVAMAAYAAYTVATASNFRAALPKAEQLLKLANGLRQASLEVQIKDLVDEYNDFTVRSEAENEKLVEAAKLLENKSLVSPLVIFGETPENYYARTIHSGNIGTVGFAMLHDYVDMALTLPTISQTIGEPDGSV